MPDLAMFVPIAKVDVQRREVWGVAAEEQPDKADEVFDYTGSRPHFEAWSKSFAAATGGKSLGNLRAMHGPIAAGKMMDISFDDAGKKIEICAKVVDEGEWQKVKEGVYTGFSQGGSYKKRWTDAESGLTRYTANPTEVSLVDLPCLPSASFEMVKRVGDADRIEKVAFKTVIDDPEPDAIKAEAEALAKAAADGRAWREFAETALTTLMKRHIGYALEKLAPDEGSVVPSDPAADTKKRFEPEQIWACGCADHKHFTKAEAVGCMRKRATEEEVTQITSPLDASLSKLESALGVNLEKGGPGSGPHKGGGSTAKTEAEHKAAAAYHSKRAGETSGSVAAGHRAAENYHKTAGKALAEHGSDSSEYKTAANNARAMSVAANSDDDRAKKIAKAAKTDDTDPGKAHRDAADAHDTAADLHESMAAKDDTSADDAKDHLDAAAAHKRAAAAHRRAADLHGKKDAGADDASKKAGMLTANAAQKSDGMFGKDAPSGALTKFTADEARDSSGKWSSGSAADHARKEATSVTHALAQSAFAMGVGHAGGHVGQKIGATVGRLAGKAIALAATRNSAAAEGGAAVGEKVGSLAGNLAGRMYGEARGWAMAAGAKTKGLEKGLYAVGRFAELIQSLTSLQQDCASEAEREGDNSPLPTALRDQIKALCGSLTDMVREETAELFGGETEGGAYDAPQVLAMAAGLTRDARAALVKISEDVPGLKKVADALEEVEGDGFNRVIDTFITEMQALGKAGARNSTADKSRIQKAHDLMNELGADCMSKAAPAEVGSETSEDMEKLRQENDGLRSTMETMSARVEGLVTKVAEISKRAAPPKAAVWAVSKSEDTAGGDARPEVSEEALQKHLAAMDPKERALVLMKASLANPISPITGR